MPRDGSHIYAIPIGTEGIPDTTIESARYNSFVADVEQDLNLPRPIIAGGTGSDNSAAAMLALGGEFANQVVTNYDIFAFKSGSFSSAKGATAAPTADADYVGAAVVTGTDSIVLEARALGTAAAGVRYVREKKKLLPTDPTAVWDATWTVITSPNDKVNKAGDTMTGSLTLSQTTTGTNTSFVLNKAAAVDYNLISGNVAGAPNWRIDLSDTAGNLAIHRWLDGGAYGGSPFGIVRTTGDATFANNVGIVGACAINGTLAVTGGVSGNLGVSGALNVTGGITAGGLTVNAGILSAVGGGGTGTYYFGNTLIRYITYDGANISFVNLGGVYLNNALNCGAITSSGAISSGAISCSTINSGAIASNSNIYAAGTLGSGGNLAVGGSDFSLHGINFVRNVGDGNNYIRTGSDESYGMILGGSAQGWVNYYRNETHYFQNSAGNVNLARIRNEPSPGPYFEIFSRLDISGDGFKPGGGVWNDNSDARIKNVLGDYTSGLDEIISLTPKRFTFKGNDTRQPPEEESAPYKNSLHYQPAISGKEFIGLVAQEAEAVMPELVKKTSGYIDGAQVSDVRELDTTALIFALVNAVRQLTARVEDLEATR